MTVDVPTGEVTWREVKDHKSEVKSEHIELPPDLMNGMMPLTVENFPQKTPELKVSYVVATSKPCVVTLSIKPDGEDRALVGGIDRRANRFNLHVEIGGVAGMIAPAFGKQPSDTKLWIMDGDVPTLVKMEGALYDKGPIWTMVLTSPAWPSNSNRN